MPKKLLYIKTYGCQMNTNDSAKIVNLLYQSHAFECTNDPYKANFLLLNTCSIREKAHNKVFTQLGLWKAIKAMRPEIIIGVGGCVASQEGILLRQKVPYVDIVFGPRTLNQLPDMLDKVLLYHKPVVEIIPSNINIKKSVILPEQIITQQLNKDQQPSAFVSIMEGCNRECTFCIVPYTRGKEISRALDVIISEIEALSHSGVHEVILLGQNVNSYHDISDGQVVDLAFLIECIAKIPSIKRIRYTTSHPLSVSNRLVQVYGKVSKLANHLHLPLQSGSDRILKLMRRGYTLLQYKEKIKNLRNIRPDISISSDFIVGFPGETEKDFTATMDAIEDLNFDRSFSFIYSPRPGTVAAKIEDDTPIEIKKERLNILQSKIKANSIAISLNMIGTVQRVLVENQITSTNPDNNQQFIGKTDNNRLVKFGNNLSLANLVGNFVEVLITEATCNHLSGYLASKYTH